MEERKLKRKKEKAQLENNYEQLYYCCKELGDNYLRDEDNEAALLEYKEAEKAAKRLSNKLYIALINRMIGETLCAMGEFEKAIKHQKIHLEYSKEEDNLIEEQRALATLGRTYFVQAESFSESELIERGASLRLSHKYYLKSLNICERLPFSNQLSQKTMAEMKSRLFLNLGLTSEAEGNTTIGVEYISKAIVICKNMELWEDLCRCYTAQGSLHYRQCNSARALSAYDEALQVVERVEKKVQMTCELLSLKSDVLIMLSDYNGAKNVLIKAYKMKTPDVKDRAEIEEKLKTVVLICRSENNLLETSETDYAARKTLNETLGDCCVKLKDFNNAIRYYTSTLECATALGLQGKDITPIYYSLSQTYKDNKQYELSIEYSRKEFDLIKDNPAEACKTLLNITETMELMKMPYDEIISSYQECLLLSKKSADLRTEAYVLKCMKQIHMDYGREELAYETEKELDTINCILPDSEEYTEAADVEVIDDDIDLDELSDVYSEDEDELSGRERHSRRRIPKASITRRNEKGETPLHVASAKGNVKLINSLVKQGHPVNIPDAAGWSPLHEACNHGQIEAASLLIELGAHIDDRGGPSCDGITPLLDAASNGHLELITLLLDKGASPLAKTNQGDTVLDCLLACRQRAVSRGEKFDYETQTYFESVVKRLKDCYSKVGQSCTTSSKSTIHQVKQPALKTPKKVPESPREESFSNYISNSRKRAEAEVEKASSSATAATREYKDVIEALRRRNKDLAYNDPVDKQKKSALLAEEEVGDDWLDNDLAGLDTRPVKRRREEFVGLQLRQPNKTASTSHKNNKPTYSNLDDFDDMDRLFEELEVPQLPIKNRSPEREMNGMEEDFESPLRNSSHVERPISQLRYQKSLLSLNFKRFNPPANSTQELTSSPSRPPARETASPPVSLNQSISSRPTQSIKVRIEGKLFLVPLPQSEGELNIAWLAAEASRRYKNTEGVSPILNLSTLDGALLDANDPVSIIFNTNEICGTIVSLKLAPLTERYREACLADNTEVDNYLEIELDKCEVSSHLEVKDRRLSLKVLTPLFKAIQHYQRLQQVCLSSVFLKDQDFKLLIDYISKLKEIRSLNVSVNNITNNGLAYFAQSMSSGSLNSLEELDMSFNPLGENCGHNLSTLSQHLPNLVFLCLKSVGITSQCLYGSYNFVLDAVESLDISYNKLEREGIAKFFSALNNSRIRFLNISSTGGSEVLRECILFLDRGHLDSLESLCISDLDVDDEDVNQLVQSLKLAPELIKLDLSNNRRVSVKSHQTLSHLENLKELHLAGCDLFTGSNELSLAVRQLSLSSDLTLKGLREAPYSFATNINEFVF